MSLKQLEVFVAIGKYGSMSSAIQKLHITQSACSMALATLERQLNYPLFERRGKKLILNEHGKALFPKAANLLNEAKEIEQFNLSQNSSILMGNLTIGASLTIANYVLPKLIVDFIKQYPAVNVQLQTANTNQVIQQLLKFNLDVGVIEGSCQSDKIETFIWKKDPLMIVAAPSYHLAKKKKVTLSEILQAKWIMREQGSGTRKTVEKALGESLCPFLEFNSIEAIKTAVILECGITCLARSSITELLQQKKLIEIKTPFLNLTRDFLIVWHKERHRTLLIDTFIQHICANKD